MTLVLLLVVVFSTVLGCGKSEVSGESNSTVASAEATQEETTVAELISAAEESTASESATVKEVAYFKDYKMDYSFYPISDETKAMLIKRLTNLKLEKGQKFDMNSLSFKENEQSARNRMISIFISAIGGDFSDNMIECKVKKLELFKIDSNDDGMVFYFKQVYKD